MVPMYGFVHIHLGLSTLDELHFIGGQLFDSLVFGIMGFGATQYLPVDPASQIGLLSILHSYKNNISIRLCHAAGVHKQLEQTEPSKPK